MTAYLIAAGLFLGAYLLGSTPFGLLAGFLKGVDIREHGSKNIGATNAARVLGKPWFFVVLVLDAAKGAGCALAGVWLTGPGSFDLGLIGGLGALLGHFFSVYLRFRGGKGVATGLGIVLVLAAPPDSWVPWPGLVAIALFIVALAITRMISASSMVAAVCLPLAYGLWLGGAIEQASFLTRLVFFCVVALAVIVKHRSNIRRILAGIEPRIGQKSAATPPGIQNEGAST